MICDIFSNISATKAILKKHTHQKYYLSKVELVEMQLNFKP